MIAIIDYGAGNLFSVKNALDYLQIENCVTEKAEIIRRADSSRGGSFSGCHGKAGKEAAGVRNSGRGGKETPSGNLSGNAAFV